MAFSAVEQEIITRGEVIYGKDRNRLEGGFLHQYVAIEVDFGGQAVGPTSDAALENLNKRAYGGREKKVYVRQIGFTEEAPVVVNEG